MAYLRPNLPVDRLPPRQALVLALVLTLLVALSDHWTGYEIRLSVLYLIPIAVAAWMVGLASAIGFAIFCSLIWLVSFRTQHLYQDQTFYFWEAGGMLCGFLAIAWLSARLQRALRQADERFFRVLEEIDSAAYVVDWGEGSILYANPKVLRIFGESTPLSPNALAARLEPAEENPEISPATVPDAKRGQSSGTYRDRQTGCWYMLQDWPIPWGSNPDVRLQVLTDISNQKEAERLRARNLQMMHHAAQLATLAETASTLAHEINQPLMVIATYTDACQRLLQAKEPDPSEISTVLEKCHAQAVRAATIIERLREFIRERRPQPQPCDAQGLVAAALDIVRAELDEAQVSIDIDPAMPAGMLEADKTLLVQVLVNLLRNAIDAMREIPPEQRRLVLSSERNPHELVIAVRDRGHGLDPATRDEIFAPFVSGKPDGLGLGLAISHSIVSAHGGRLWASNNEDGGATFYLALPGTLR